MSDDIEAVRTAAAAIVDSEVGTENEPSLYILVPFNDPGVTFGRRGMRGAILAEPDVDAELRFSVSPCGSQSLDPC